MNALAINGGPMTINPTEARYIWPRITQEMRGIAISQMEGSLSIYDRSGIFKEFEEKFANYHGMPYALLSNSGTSAISSMFEGIGLCPGDEVICPAYTFFATVSPVMHTGAIPVLCDCDESGNIDPLEIERKITTRTKAVIVTHMWGIPCDMRTISNICKDKGVYLFEDCSHAHGASFAEQKVGSFGDASAWSLQGQKIVTGGEGGIMLTRNRDIHIRALLQGHYNKRCKQEIPKDHELYRYALTGLGLKFRAHPIAIAIASHQFNQLDDWIAQKQQFVDEITASLKRYPFLKMPSCENRQASWYALTMQFLPELANGVTINQFEKALHAEGLIEVDHPGSTGPIHNLALFTNPERVLSRLYHKPIKQHGSFDQAIAFYEQAIKMPVWAFADERPIVEAYIRGLAKVCDAVMQRPDSINSISVRK